MSMMLQGIPQDVVTVRLSAEEYITSDTVKVIVDVTMMLTEKTANARNEILGALKKVIDAEWRFASLTRTEDTGMERIQANVYTRVPEKEVANVTIRAKEGCSKGLKLVMKDVQYAPPKKQIEDTLDKLRKVIYKKAQAEAASLNESTGAGAVTGAPGQWRIGEISFFDMDAVGSANIRSGKVSAMSYSNAQSMPGEDDETDGIDVTQRVFVLANVKLERLALTVS